MEHQLDDCIRWQQRDLSMCFSPVDGYVKYLVTQCLTEFKGLPVYCVPLQGFLLDYKNLKVVDSYVEEGNVHRMVDVRGDFKLLSFNAGARIKAVVQQVCAAQVICIYLDIYEVVLNVDAATWAPYTLDIGHEVTVQILGLCQTARGKFCVRGELLEIGEPNISIVDSLNTSGSVGKVSSLPVTADPSLPPPQILTTEPAGTWSSAHIDSQSEAGEELEGLIQRPRDKSDVSSAEDGAGPSQPMTERKEEPKVKAASKTPRKRKSSVSKPNSSKDSVPEAGGSLKKVKRRGDLPPGFQPIMKGSKKHYFFTEQPEKRFTSVNSCWEFYSSVGKVASEATDTTSATAPENTQREDVPKEKAKEAANDSDSRNEEDDEDEESSDSEEDDEPAPVQKLIIPPAKDASPSSSESSSEDEDDDQTAATPSLKSKPAPPASFQEPAPPSPVHKPAPASPVRRPAPVSPVRKPAPPSPVRKPAPSPVVRTPADLKLKPLPATETKKPDPTAQKGKSASSSDSDSDSPSDESVPVSVSQHKASHGAVFKSPIKEKLNSKPNKDKPQPSLGKITKEKNSLNGSPKVSVPSHNESSAVLKTPKPSMETKRKVETKDSSSSSESDDDLSQRRMEAVRAKQPKKMKKLGSTNGFLSSPALSSTLKPSYRAVQDINVSPITSATSAKKKKKKQSGFD